MVRAAVIAVATGADTAAVTDDGTADFIAADIDDAVGDAVDGVVAAGGVGLNEGAVP